nr:MAG TPA: hypothetical protein [Caudoviricetes sp.]
MRSARVVAVVVAALVVSAGVTVSSVAPGGAVGGGSGPAAVLRQSRPGDEEWVIVVGPADEQHDDRGRVDGVLTPEGAPVMAQPEVCDA